MSHELPTETLNPIEEAALRWLVRKMNRAAWTEEDEQEFQVWRRASPEHDRQFARHEFIAGLISQPQAYRDVISSIPVRHAGSSASKEAEVEKTLAEAKDYLKQAARSQSSPLHVIALLDEAINRLRSLLVVERACHRQLLARALMQRGDTRRDLGVQKHLDAILKDYDDAETQLIALLPDQNPSWRDDLADVCTGRGVALMHCGSRAGLTQALTCFDRAIEIRRPLLAAGESWHRYSMTAAWMNRGDTLSRLGGAADLDAALAAYTEAFGLMRGIPLASEPMFRRRFVVACLNRCSIYLERNGAGDPENAVACCDEALAILPEGGTGLPVEVVLKASVWANRAAALARLNPAETGMLARESSRTAINLVAGLEGQDWRAAQAGIIARHALCATIARLVATRIEGEFRAVLVSEAMTAVTDGMKAARQWGNRGFLRFRSLATELFHFGGRLSEQYQPHLLGAFVLAQIDAFHSDGDCTWREELRCAAIALLDQAIQNILTVRLAGDPSSEVSDYFLDSLPPSRAARAELAGKT